MEVTMLISPGSSMPHLMTSLISAQTRILMSLMMNRTVQMKKMIGRMKVRTMIKNKKNIISSMDKEIISTSSIHTQINNIMAIITSSNNSTAKVAITRTSRCLT